MVTIQYNKIDRSFMNIDEWNKHGISVNAIWFCAYQFRHVDYYRRDNDIYKIQNEDCSGNIKQLNRW